MSDTTTFYRGWFITLRCLKHRNSDPRPQRSYTCRAWAVLHDMADAPLWSDTRPQTSAIVDRVFSSSAASVEALLTQTKELIDTLKNVRSVALPPGAAQ